MTNKTCTCEGRSADPLTLYTVSDVANTLGLSEKTVRRMISRREIGTIRTAGSLRMTRRHLEAWQNLNDVPAITGTARRAA
jgi:excisionase family DNA binding protein